MKIGVLGGGQLGRMLALAGYPLGLRFRFLDPAPEAPVEEPPDKLWDQIETAIKSENTNGKSSGAERGVTHLPK